MFKYFFILFFSIFFIGCTGGGSTQPKPNTMLPNWAINSKASTSVYYYAIGEGVSKEEAKKDALKQISSAISVTISSSTTTTKTATEDSYKRKIQDIVKSSTQKIKFTGVRVLRNAFANGIWYSEIQVNRKILFQAQKDVMLLEYNRTLKLWKKIKQGNAFTIFREDNKLNKHINKVMAQLPILKSINNKFDLDKYSSVMQNIREKSIFKKSSVIVYVKTKNAFNEKIVLEKAISDFGVKIAQKLSNVKSRKNLIIVDIAKKSKVGVNRYKTRKMRGVKFANITLTITTYDGTGKTIVAQNIIYLTNASRDSYKDAMQKTKKFEREIKRRGILNILLETISK